MCANRFLPKCFYSKQIYSYVENLVLAGANKYQELSTSEKNKVSALIIKELGADDFESMLGEDCNQTMQIFSESLFNNNEDSDKKLLNLIKSNAIANHAWQVDELIQEIKSSHHVSRQFDSGFMPYVDRESGDLMWRRL